MMVLKIFAIAIAVIAVSLTYMHEYHRDKILYLNSNFPAIRSSVASLHKFIIDFTPKIFLSPHTSQPSKDSADRIFAPEELLKFRGEKGSPEIYLAIFGKVFDVTKGSKHYGPGGSYHAFAGQDASRAFVTGDFSEEGLTDDVMGLSPDDLKSIQDWSLFYHEEYIFKGKLVGRYYDSNGERTEYYRKVDSLIKQALDKTAAQNADYAKYPPCNVEWSAENGSKVWCSKKSGGIERNWAGVPRKYYKPGASSYRCACIEVTEDINQRKGNIEEYEGCSFEAEYCHIRD